MNLWAKVKFKEEENAYHLLRSFFNEFDPRSSIVIRGREAEVKIYFENQPPLKSVDTISHCCVDEFVYNGELLHERNEKGTSEQTEPKVTPKEIPKQVEQATPLEKTPEQAVPATSAEEISEQAKPMTEEKLPKQHEPATLTQSEEPKKKKSRYATKKAEGTKEVKNKAVNIPELEELAKQATSFEHFAKLVGEWLEMGVAYQDFFVNLVLASTEVDKVSWNELSSAMQSKKQFFSETHKIMAGQKVSKKLKSYSVTILPLLRLMGQYKNYPFGQEQPVEKTSAGQETEQAEQLASSERTEETTTAEAIPAEAEDGTHPKRVKMACMPEIPLFEVGLGSVDETQPIEERVEYVLRLMGWNELNPQEKEEVFEIANLAVRLEGMTLDMVHEIGYEMMSIPPVYDWDVARMTFAKFINDFTGKYAPGKNVQLHDFLKDLQNAIMLETEIQSFDDFIQSIRK